MLIPHAVLIHNGMQGESRYRRTFEVLEDNKDSISKIQKDERDSIIRTKAACDNADPSSKQCQGSRKNKKYSITDIEKRRDDADLRLNKYLVPPVFRYRTEEAIFANGFHGNRSFREICYGTKNAGYNR